MVTSPPAPRARTRRASTGRFGSVIFDCDSTLSAVEGIAELSGAHWQEIQALTNAAMDGRLPLEEVYGQRLEVIRPTRADVDALAQRYAAAAVPDAAAVVAALQRARVDVRVLSGGLLPAVAAFARTLGIDAEHVAAVGITFDYDGAYAGFDRASPLTVSGGKAVVVHAWQGALPRPVMLVGDGVTDLEAATAVDLFVAFAGVIDRATVTSAAPIVIRDRSLAPVLALALGDDPPRNANDRALYERGRACLDGARQDRILHRPPSPAGSVQHAPPRDGTP